MMRRLLTPLTEPVYFCLRVILGLMFAFHGVQKLFGVLTDHRAVFGTQMWIGAVIELAAGTLIAVGLLTRIAAFLASGQMAVAYFQFHWKFEGGSHILPAINKGELAVVYCFVFLYIACRGAGPWSIDRGR